MRRLWVIGLLALTGCTFAVNDPDRFDKNANEVIKKYKAEHHRLYECFVGNASVPTDLTYQTLSRSTYEKKGLVKVTFETTHPNKTAMRIKTISGGDWTVKPERYVAIADECAEKQKEKP